jgi:DNA-directed RNA polymerase specialized sigma24 family protein
MQPFTSPAAVRPFSVNPALTLNRPADPAPTPSPARRSRRRRDDVENPQFAAFVRRIIRAHGRRVAEGDVEGLAELLALADELDTATRTAVAGLREAGFSWGEIASRLGTSRQAVQQRWGVR